MIKLKVDNQKFNLIDNLSVEDWMDLMRWDFEAQPHWPHIIGRVTNLEASTIDQMTAEQQHLAVTLIAHSLTLRQPITLPDFNKVTFGQFIDMEYYIAMGTHKSINYMLDVLQVKAEGIQQALYVTEEYIKWRNNIYKQYSALFGLEDTQEDDSIEDNKQSAQQVAKSWYTILVDLANDDLLKIDAVTDKLVREVFNFMAVRKERQLAELNKAKQQKRQYDLQGARR